MFAPKTPYLNSAGEWTSLSRDLSPMEQGAQYWPRRARMTVSAEPSDRSDSPGSRLLGVSRVPRESQPGPTGIAASSLGLGSRHNDVRITLYRLLGFCEDLMARYGTLVTGFGTCHRGLPPDRRRAEPCRLLAIHQLPRVLPSRALHRTASGAERTSGMALTGPQESGLSMGTEKPVRLGGNEDDPAEGDRDRAARPSFGHA